jgi:hypothetical protein
MTAFRKAWPNVRGVAESTAVTMPTAWFRTTQNSASAGKYYLYTDKKLIKRI